MSGCGCVGVFGCWCLFVGVRIRGVGVWVWILGEWMWVCGCFFDVCVLVE